MNYKNHQKSILIDITSEDFTDFTDLNFERNEVMALDPRWWLHRVFAVTSINFHRDNMPRQRLPLSNNRTPADIASWRVHLNSAEWSCSSQQSVQTKHNANRRWRLKHKDSPTTCWMRSSIVQETFWPQVPFAKDFQDTYPQRFQTCSRLKIWPFAVIGATLPGNPGLYSCLCELIDFAVELIIWQAFVRKILRQEMTFSSWSFWDQGFWVSFLRAWKVNHMN